MVSIFVFSLSQTSFANINQIDSLKKILRDDNLNNNEKPEILFKISLKQYQLQNYPDAINNAIEALDLFKKNNNKKKEGAVLEYLGIYYAEFSDYQNSIKYLLKALKIAEEQHDSNSIYSRDFNIGTTFIEAGNRNKGIEFIKKAITYYQSPKTRNVKFLVAGHVNLGVVYNDMNILDSAMFYSQIAANIARDENYSQQIGASLLNIGDIYFKQNEIEKALKQYGLALVAFKSSSDIQGIWHTKYGIANAFSTQGKLSEAIDLYEQVIPHYKEVNDLNYLAKSLSELSNIQEKLNNFKLALSYKNQFIEVKDSIAESEILNKLADLELQYRIEKLQNENQSKLKILNQQKKISSLRWYGSTGILVIIIILIITLYNKNKTQNKLVEAQLVNTKLEQSKLKDELVYRNKELENFALHIVQKNDFLMDVKSSLKDIKTNASDKNIEEIKKLSFNVNQALRVNKELEKFRERVDDVNSHFFKLLIEHYPDLTEKEKRLCALLKLNLSSKEIATLNNISEGAVTMARYRLRKKIGLNTDDNLAELFQKLG